MVLVRGFPHLIRSICATTRVPFATRIVLFVSYTSLASGVTISTTSTTATISPVLPTHIGLVLLGVFDLKVTVTCNPWDGYVFVFWFA